MKKMVVMLVLCGLATSAMAQEWNEGWTTTVDLSYTCKYMWRGFDILDNAGAFQPSIDFAHESGFGATLWMSYPERGGQTNELSPLGRVNLTEYNYVLYYMGKALEGNCWETDYKVGYRYYDYIDNTSKALDSHEAFIEAEMPQLTGTAFVPRVAVYTIWPTSHDYRSGNYGIFYQAGFSYLLPTEEELPNLPLTFSWYIQYIDGSNIEADHDLSHMVWGLQTEMTCPMTGARIVPALYFQNSFDDSVNTQDEFWGSISYSFTF